MNNYIFLQDKKFLHELLQLRIKEEYIKITVLNWEEEPLKEVQGITISGSINLDGNSAMRRTASLSIFADNKSNDLTGIDSLFAINKKCILQLGIKNTVPLGRFSLKDKQTQFITFEEINYQKLYGDIVWFPLGVYIMFNPSIAHGLDGVTISMQLKDKMCLLNGQLGGQIHSSVDFAHLDQDYDIYTGLTLEKKPVLIYNIIKQLVNHWGNEQLSKIIISEVPLQIKKVVSWNADCPIYVIDSIDAPNLFTNKNTAKQWIKNNLFTNEDEIESYLQHHTYNPGQDIGFVYSDFIYPEGLGEFSSNIGDTVTSMLDKLINIMGNYEYFYDVYGNFIFQQKPNYLNMSNVAYWAKETSDNEKIIQLPVDAYQIEKKLTKPIYNFIGNTYTTAFNNSLNYNNIKNDFVVWGAYKSTNGTTFPCRFHLAIDKKPNLNSHKIILYEDDYQIIRALAYDENKTYEEGTVIIENRISTDWRQEIYYQMLEDEILGTGQNTELNNTYFQYYAELKEEFPKIFDLNGEEQAIGWKEQIKQHPEQIKYFLDFLDEDTELGKYSVRNIGRRSKVIDSNNEGINCVFQPNIPDIVYLDINHYGTIENIRNTAQNLTNYGQNWIQIPSDLANNFKTGGVLNSCYQKIKDLLYQFTNMNNTISITGLPIYFLEPNTRITVEDEISGIEGDFIIQSMTLPLDISSTMNINAYKALQKI